MTPKELLDAQDREAALRAQLEYLTDVAYRATHIAKWWAIPHRLREELKQAAVDAQAALVATKRKP